MDQVTDQTNQILNLIVQVVIIVAPILITWFIRTYVQGTKSEHDIAAIMRLSNSAIDYVENLDNRGDLKLDPDISKGVQKLQIAGSWLESELNRTGISMTDEDAQKWISSEFQKRIGEVRMVGLLAELAKTAVGMVNNLEQNGLLKIPPGADRVTHQAELAADWVVAQYAEKGAAITREEALTWVRAELLKTLQTVNDERPANIQLRELAQQAVAFLNGLKKSGRLAVQSGSFGGDVEADIATAWLLTEAAKQGLTVNSDQIAETIKAALVPIN
jgi:hypothetical protein